MRHSQPNMRCPFAWLVCCPRDENAVTVRSMARSEAPWPRQENLPTHSIERGGRATARVGARSTAVTITAITGRAPAVLAAARIVSRESLHDPVAGEHAAIDRKVPADHKGPHSRILLSQRIRGVSQICLVLASVHQHKAREATGVSVAFVRRIHPPTPPAEA